MTLSSVPLLLTPRYNDTLVHLGRTPFAYRQCWGASGGHNWDNEAVGSYAIAIVLTGRISSSSIGCGQRYSFQRDRVRSSLPLPQCL